MSSYRNKGFTLLEALIAVLVLSLGLLGIAAMQLKAMQGAHVAHQRSIATLAAQDAVERLWIELGETPPNCPDALVLNGAEDDSWHAEWVVHLPELSSSPVTNAGCVYTITVDWVDDRFDGEDVSRLAYIVRLPGEE